jgi:hypothetical protein
MATQLVATPTTTEDGDLLSKEELHRRLLAVGESRYHHLHPFHLRMHAGELTRAQLQAWTLNRYYYQSRIPIKIRYCSPRAMTQHSDAPGENGYSVTMGTKVVLVALRNGYSSPKPPVSRAIK